MNSTVDNLNTKIITKIQCIKNILLAYQSHDELSADMENQIEIYLSKINECSVIYELGSIEILAEYYKGCSYNKTDDVDTSNINDVKISFADFFDSCNLITVQIEESVNTKKDLHLETVNNPVKKVLSFVSETINHKKQNQNYDKFIKFINTNNTIGVIKYIFRTICERLSRVYGTTDEIDALFETYNTCNVEVDIPATQTGNCQLCHIPYTIHSKTSEYICSSCGCIEKIHGIYFEDEQTQDTSRMKHGKYEPSKHCRFWVDRIQAKENVEIPQKIIDAIVECINRDEIRLEQLTCELVRSYLKELHLTTYNNHVSLIRKQITQKEPTQLTDTELKLIYVHFNKIIQIFNKIKPDNKLICSYHPYFIYKIIEQILKHRSQMKRKKEILSCIHLQSRDTLIENDNMWYKICEYIKDFTYIPTENR